MASVWTLQFHSVSFPHQISSNLLELKRNEFGLNFHSLNGNGTMASYSRLVLRASSDSVTSSDDDKRVQDEILVVHTENEKAAFKSQNPISRFQQSILSLPPVILLVKKRPNSNHLIGLGIVATVLVVFLRIVAARKKLESGRSSSGSVADLVRRGQLRSDRRGITSPLKFDDPFNNPMVKVGKSNSTVEMCGRVYRLAPVTLTKEQEIIHQKRRSRAYQWKRPTIFLREGDSIPPDVDPDRVRWIPANHPFATTASDIDEGLAQNNVYQKHGVPFRIQAEHEALQRKLEALQNDQTLNNLVIDPGAAEDYERPFKSHLKLDHQAKQSTSSNAVSSKPSRSDRSHNTFRSNTGSEELGKP